jgi:plastocyanin
MTFTGRPHVLFAFAVALLVAFGLAWYATSAEAQDSSVSVGDNFYEPSTGEVDVGSTITWTNVGATVHTVTSDEGGFDSGIMDPGASYSVFFEFAGTYAYSCQVHSEMSGSITILGPETPKPTPTRSPSPTPSPTAAPTAAVTDAPVATPTLPPIATTQAGTPTLAVTASASPIPSPSPKLAEDDLDDDESSNGALVLIGLAGMGLLAIVGVFALARGRKTP